MPLALPADSPDGQCNVRTVDIPTRSVSAAASRFGTHRAFDEYRQFSKSIMRIAREHAQTLPSPEALERFGTYNMLALIHDSICHLVPPVGQLAKVLPALEQIVNSLAEQQATLTEILSIQKDSALARKATDKFDGVFSLSHSV